MCPYVREAVPQAAGARVNAGPWGAVSPAAANGGDVSAKAEPGTPRATRHRALTARPGEEAEIQALVRIQRALAPLDPDSRSRVLAWFAQPSAPMAGNEGRTSAGSEFEDLSALFEAAGPKTEPERVLVACHYHQRVRGESDVLARLISDELKQLGHGSPHTSWIMHQLNTRDPAYLMVTSKSGSGRGTKYRYRLTSAGTKRVLQMLESRAETSSSRKQ